MTSSGTTNFNPAIGETVLYSYNLCGIRNTALTQEHMVGARMAMNNMLADWANKGVNLWKVQLVTVPVVQGQATYSVPSDTVVMLDAYVTISNGVSDNIDRIILPVSRSEYASYPDKQQQGFTTVFWFNRQISPTVTLWPVPDGTSYQFLNYYRVVQIQDADFTDGQTADVPYRWQKAFSDGLALELARSWAPTLIEVIAPFATTSYQTAAGNDVETSAFYISPMLSGYYRP